MMLEVKNLTKVYGENKSVTDISFSVGRGETVGLLGPNGAGKSTTMRMLTGYLTPTAGTVTIEGIDVSENPLEARRYVGYLPEIPPLYTDMTVREHLEFICSLRGVAKEKEKAEIDKVCGYLNISHVSERLIGNLSKGYRQRVGFAASLVGDPQLLILDEPTVGLDPGQIVEIRNLIQRLSGKMTIIISSHILSEISSVCSRIIILNKGRVAADGTPAEIEARHGDKVQIEVGVKGDQSRAEWLLQSCVRGRSDVEVRFLGAEGAKQGGSGLNEKSPAAAVENGPAAFASQGGTVWKFLVTAPKGVDLREDIFRVFAVESVRPSSAEADSTPDSMASPEAGEGPASRREAGAAPSLVTLRSLNKTLEDIFMDIIEGR